MSNKQMGAQFTYLQTFLNDISAWKFYALFANNQVNFTLIQTQHEGLIIFVAFVVYLIVVA